MKTHESDGEAHKIMELAIGRIFRLGSRPFEDGDIGSYENAKRAFLEAAESIGIDTYPKPQTIPYGRNFGGASFD